MVSLLKKKESLLFKKALTNDCINQTLETGCSFKKQLQIFNRTNINQCFFFLNMYHFHIYHIYIYESLKVCFIIHYFTDKETEAQKCQVTKFTCLETDGGIQVYSSGFLNLQLN